MAEHIDEQISALVDGELSKEECRRLMEELRVDPAAAASWCNYHLISAALKNNLPTSLSSDFASRASKLNDYLASHGQYSALTGVLPQVRSVGFERSQALPPTVRATER